MNEFLKTSVGMRGCCNKSNDGHADGQSEKSLQTLPTPFGKTQLSPKLLGFQIQ